MTAIFSSLTFEFEYFFFCGLLFYSTTRWSYGTNLETVVEVFNLHCLKTQSAGAVEYTDCISGYDIKQSDGEVPVMLELWGMQSTSSLPSLPGSL